MSGHKTTYIHSKKNEDINQFLKGKDSSEKNFKRSKKIKKKNKKYLHFSSSMVAHGFNPNTWETATGVL